MATLTGISADGILEGRYLSDRRGVLLRAKYPSPGFTHLWDSELFGTPAMYPSSGQFPKIRASASANTGSNASATSLTIPLPTGWQVGDLCYISWIQLVTGAVLSPPSGWTAVFTNVLANGETRTLHGVWKRVLQAGDVGPTSTGWTVSGKMAAISIAIYDFDPVTNEDVVAVTDPNAGVTAPSVRAPSITPVSLGSLLITSHASRNGTSGVTNMAITPAPGMTEIRDTAAVTSSTNVVIEVASQQLSSLAATGTKTATVTGSTVTSLNQVGSAILVRAKTQAASALSISGGFVWKNVGALGPHRIYYDPPGTAVPAYQWCGALFAGGASASVVNEAVALVTATNGSAVTAAFNASATDMIVACVTYNADIVADAAGSKVAITNNKGLTVIEAVQRGHLEEGVRGGAAIFYMYTSGAQTSMTVTATLSGVSAAYDDLALKVYVISNLVAPSGSTPDGNVEGTKVANSKESFDITSQTITKGVAIWAINDTLNLGAGLITESAWTAATGTSAKSATTPLAGLSSVLITWTSTQFGARMTLPDRSVITGPKKIRLSFMIKGTEAINPAWNEKTSGKARLEVRFIDTLGRPIKTNVLGFPGSTTRSWSTDLFVPKGITLKKIEIWGYGWDSSAAARLDDVKITELYPDYVRFLRKTDGGYVRGGHPALCVSGTAYAYDDELTPNQLTEWTADAGYLVSDPYDTVYGNTTSSISFTIEDRDPSIPSTLIKSLETPGLLLYLATDQRNFTRSRSTTFVNKQTTGKPAGGVNSAYSASGDYLLITKTVQEMNDLIAILDETILYISPTARYNRLPFFATVSEYVITDFARMDSVEHTFVIRFQEVERPDTQWSGSFLPLRDYTWLTETYDTYDNDELKAMTYDQLAFAAVP